MTEISFFVPSAPVAQPRQRHAVIGGQVRNYTTKDHPVHQFKRDIQTEAYNAYEGKPLDGPIRLELTFLLPRPKSIVWKKKLMPRLWARVKPDFDNLAKAVCDALNGILWADDSQVVDASVKKMYAAGGEEPGVYVLVTELSECEAG